MIDFEQPWLLVGAGAAAIPLAIHLIDRRRPRRVPFSAFDFVLRSQKHNQRRLRLRRVLIFLARTLLLLAIPLALARPRAGNRGTEMPLPSQAAAEAVVLDASRSMSYVWHGSSLFDSARALALSHVRKLRPQDSATFLLCTAHPALPASPTFDRSTVARAIEDAQVTEEPADVAGCVQRAAAALGDSRQPIKRVVVASNLAAANYRGEPFTVVHGSSGSVVPEIVLLDPRAGTDVLPNLAITEVHLEPASALGPRGFTFNFTVANHDDHAVADVDTALRIEDRLVARGTLAVPAHGTAQKTLSYQFPGGGIFHGDVELKPDALADDDRRFFVTAVPRELHVLVVDGAASTNRMQDEAFFVEAALSAPGSPISATVVDADRFNEVPLAPALDAVVLLDVRDLDSSRVGELERFVEKGGGLFISLGPQVDADRYRAWAELLPRPLRVVKTAVEPGAPESAPRAAHFSDVAWSQPIFEVFDKEDRDGLLAANVFRYFLLEPGAAADLQVLASFGDGAPALVTAPRGKGRLLLFTSTLDRQWNDWAIRPSYLPAVQRMARYAANALDDQELSQAWVGEAHALPAWVGTSVEVERPDRGLATVTHQKNQESSSMSVVPNLPGIYRVRSPSGLPGPSLDFAANVDTRDSDLRRLSDATIAKLQGQSAEKGAAAAGAGPSMPLWTALLLAGAFFLVSEGALLFRPSSRSPAPQGGLSAWAARSAPPRTRGMSKP